MNDPGELAVPGSDRARRTREHASGWRGIRRASDASPEFGEETPKTAARESTEPDDEAGSADAPLVRVRGLRVRFDHATRDAVAGVSFDVARGECVAIVGESGSGKSVTARALLGLAGDGARVTAEALELDGAPLPASRRDRAWRAIRGGRIGMVVQDALTSLDPLRTVGREIDDVLRLHTRLDASARRARVVELLAEVGMPEPEARSRMRADELSGGQRQRALIASALAASPALVIADEATTAVDAIAQAELLGVLRDLLDGGTALLVISHDLGVVSSLADRILVMDAGRIVELGPASRVLGAPEHAVTRALVAAHPRMRLEASNPADTVAAGDVAAERGRCGAGAANNAAPGAMLRNSAKRTPNLIAPLLVVDGVSKRFARPGAAPLDAVVDASFSLAPGETLGLVGGSGSGKSTLARVVLGLASPSTGSVEFAGAPWSPLPERRRRGRRGELGAVFQDPLSSFDPRRTVGQILADAVTGGATTRANRAEARIHELLDDVELPREVVDRRPLRLSGGQRQRVAIARAIATRPRALVCDEPVSALDVTVQAQILELLSRLQREHGLAMLFISHDLAVVSEISQRVAVMSAGRIVEQGAVAQVFAQPAHSATRALVDAHLATALPG